MHTLNRPLALLALSISLIAGFANASDNNLADSGLAEISDSPTVNLREHYTKYEFQIPMRDGVHLFTAVYVPKDASKSYPFLLKRTPYSAGVNAQGELNYGVDYFPSAIGPSPEFEASGYIFVNQDVRGRYMSEGKWQEMTPHVNPKREKGEGNESEDMYDTVEWLLKHVPNNNGKVGILGTSYPGFYTSASIINSHPAIKAASPQAPVTDLYMNDDSYHGGAFMLAANFDFYSTFTEQKNPTPLPKSRTAFNYGTSDGYEFFLSHFTMQDALATLTQNQRALLQPTIEHATYDDFWKIRNIAPHLKNIHAAVLTVGGWFDAEDLQGPLSTYKAIKRNNIGIYNGLVMGPWSHGAWGRLDGASLGNVKFDAKTSLYFRKNILFPFFEQYLKGITNKNTSEVYAFETGTNIWRNYAAWPPQQAQARTLYFGANGTLSWQAPSADSGSAFDEYVSDPKKPVPYIAYVATGVPKEYMVSDQRFAASRPDVLVYRSEPLEQDVTLVGPVSPKLFVSTTGTDADWVVKLIDVYPSEYPNTDSAKGSGKDVAPPSVSMAGYQQLVRGDPLRGKFRNSFEKPEPFTPGKVEVVSYSMSDINHTFRRGHRIMVQVQSSWFPLVDLNPQTFVDIPHAKPEDFQKATQRVFHTTAMPSGIVLQMLPM
ncbi:CocE/NonD family hydrolase [Solimicrobium silvestre]|uniref:/NonD: hydrolase CocE/NonD family protein n=1 Tax=Solimicrobium silvestre TaxID=2099400 RepID=A0A2S9GW95_9BURK|nr:CocE/NonD family hydrolase [Solimicrobium silvestre]PRC91997.1 /NonD: hydrolase CocE/NonD family protein [Solimicrobium silvestre]